MKNGKGSYGDSMLMLGAFLMVGAIAAAIASDSLVAPLLIAGVIWLSFRLAAALDDG